MNRFSSAAVAVLLVLIAPALSVAPAAAKTGYYLDAMRWYEDEAKKGTPKAQFLYGILLEKGAGGRAPDDTAAFGWFLKAAEQGYADAQYKVGAAYHFGIGTTADPAKAIDWYRRAAQQGVREAQYNLAYMLENAVGEAQATEEAVLWYRRAAEGGFGRAQLNLGYLYLRGAGVPASAEEAWAWFRAAESRGVEGAANARAEVEGALAPEALARAEALAAPRIRK